MTGPERPRRIIDFLLYLAIATGLVSAVVWYAIRSAETGGPTKLPLKWPTWVLLSLVAFGYPVRRFRRHRHSRPFWLAVLGCSAVHCAVTIPLVLRLDELPLLLCALLANVEAGIIYACLTRALHGAKS